MTVPISGCLWACYCFLLLSHSLFWPPCRLSVGQTYSPNYKTSRCRKSPSTWGLCQLGTRGRQNPMGAVIRFWGVSWFKGEFYFPNPQRLEYFWVTLTPSQRPPSKARGSHFSFRLTADFQQKYKMGRDIRMLPLKCYKKHSCWISISYAKKIYFKIKDKIKTFSDYKNSLA